MPLQQGEILIDRYEIVKAIKAGGMGRVYAARDRRLADTPCAIKELLDAELGGDNSVILRRKFQEEMRFLATLSHPGIPRIRDFFTEGDTCYLVMDLVEGESLEQVLEEEGDPGLPAERVVGWMIEVLDVLGYLHASNVLHRDIKPANIIRERVGGRIKLVDFGIARLLSHGETSTQTQLGSLSYCPLEQIQGKADPRSDLYALGATMVHLLTGQVPQPLSIPRLRKARPDVDPALATIVDRACAELPSGRYATAAAMHAALTAWGSGSGGVAVPAAAAPAPRAPMEPVDDGWQETRVVGPAPVNPWPVAAVLSMLGLLGGLWLLMGQPSTPHHPTTADAARVEVVPTPSVTPVIRVPAASPTPAPAVAPRPAPTPRRTNAAPAAPPTNTQTRVVNVIQPAPTQAAPTYPQATAPAPAPVAVAPPAPAPAPLPQSALPTPPVPPDRGGPEGPGGGGPGGGPPGGPGSGPDGGRSRPSGPPPGLPIVSTPTGWQLAASQRGERPPSMAYKFVNGSATIQALVMNVHSGDETDLTGRLIAMTEEQGWAPQAPRSEGALTVYPLQRSGGSGELRLLAQPLGNGWVRIVYARLEAPVGGVTNDIRQVADSYVIRAQ